MPDAAAQSTVSGQTIRAVAAYHGRIWTGYGDYDANTGPVSPDSVASLGDAGAPSDGFTFQTEEIGLFRGIAGNLYVPAVDPRSTVALAVNDAGTWSTISDFTPFPVHLFDVRKTVDGWWACGSADNDTDGGGAYIWHSADAATWTESLSETFMDPTNAARYYTLIPVGDDLYVQYHDLNDHSSTPPGGKKWSHAGQAWSDVGGIGPTWLRFGKARTRDSSSALILGLQTLLDTDEPNGLYLFTPTGAPSTWLAAFHGGSVYDYAVLGNAVFALTDTAVEWRSLDDSVPTWAGICAAPPGARSLTVDPTGALWIGTRTSDLYVF